MDRSILLMKLVNTEYSTTTVYKCYMDVTNSKYDSEEQEFDQYIADLKLLSETQYDFEKLTVESQLLGITRRDYRELCDIVCIIIGDRINEMCKYTRAGIITSPSKFEDYCPFTNNDVVVYGACPVHIIIDGVRYQVINTKLETTPFYTVFCNEIDKV